MCIFPYHISLSFPPDISSSSTSVDVVDAVNHRLQTTPPSTSRHTTTTTTTTSHIDPSRVTVTGPGVRLVSVSSQAEFTVSNPQPLRQEEVNVKITGMCIICCWLNQELLILFPYYHLPILFLLFSYSCHILYTHPFSSLFVSFTSVLFSFLVM